MQRNKVFLDSHICSLHMMLPIFFCSFFSIWYFVHTEKVMEENKNRRMSCDVERVYLAQNVFCLIFLTKMYCKLGCIQVNKSNHWNSNVFPPRILNFRAKYVIGRPNQANLAHPIENEFYSLSNSLVHMETHTHMNISISIYLMKRNPSLPILLPIHHELYLQCGILFEFPFFLCFSPSPAYTYTITELICHRLCYSVHGYFLIRIFFFNAMMSISMWLLSIIQIKNDKRTECFHSHRMHICISHQ